MSREEESAVELGDDDDFVEEDDVGDILTLDETEPKDDDEGMEEEFDEEDEAQTAPHMEFLAHQGEVYSVDLAPPFAVSGGEDDKAVVHDIESGKPLLLCGGHKDSVTWVRVNGKRSLLATGDMSGLVKIWNLETMKLEAEFDDATDLEWLTWHPSADILIAGAGDGMVWMWLVPTKDCKVFAGQGFSATSGRFLADGKRLLVGYGNGSVFLWDLKEGSSVGIGGPSNSRHEAPVTAVALSPNGQLGASGSEDGSLGLINLNSARYESFLSTVDPNEPAEPEKAEGGNSAVEEWMEEGSSATPNKNTSIESLEFSPDSSLLAVGCVAGRVLLWNPVSASMKYRLDTDGAGVVRLGWVGPTALLAASLDGRLRCWDSRSGQLTAAYNAHRTQILDFSLHFQADSPPLCLTAAADGSAKLFLLQ